MAAFPAAAETFGYAALEAMLCSLPVVATRNVPIARYDENSALRALLQLEGHTDWAIGQGLAEKLRWLKDNSRDAAELGRRCRAHAVRIVGKNNAKARRVIKELTCASA